MAMIYIRELLKDINRALFETAPDAGRGYPAISQGFGAKKTPAISVEKPRNFTYRDLKRLIPFVKPQWRLAVVAGALGLLSAIVVVLIPFFFKFLADNAVLKNNYRLLNIVIGLLIVALIIYTTADFLKQVYSFRFQQEVVFGIQRTLLNRLLHLPKAFFDSNNTGYLMSRSMGEIFQLQALFSLRLVDVVTKSLQLIGAVTIVIYIDWKLSLLSLAVLPFFILTARLLNWKARQTSRIALEMTANVAHNLEERLSGVSLIKTFATEEREQQKLQSVLREAYQANHNKMIVTALYSFLSGMINAVGLGMVLWYGSSRVLNKQLTIGELLAFSAYLGFIIEPARFLAGLSNIFQHAFAAFERVFELMDRVPEAGGQNGCVTLHRIKGAIKFEDVSFSYNGGKRSLENISFEVKPGQLVSIVGQSGAGKSTLINLVLGLYRPASGRILYDGLLSTEISLNSLRKRIGVVSQEILLFNESIKDNIRYGHLDASDEEVFRAADMAGSHHFICGLPEGYETKVGEKGVRLSVGQKQRLSIARAILKNPDVLILDEPTSALDPMTEQIVQEMLQDFCRGRTTFVVAHRLSTVMMSNMILVLDKGRIIQCGTHQELFNQAGLYHRLCLNQLLHIGQPS